MSKSKVAADISVPEELIKELLTESEWRMVQKRLQIIKLLQEGLSIRTISSRAGVGTDTVVRISRRLERSPVLQKQFSKIDVQDSSKWVFGNYTKD